MIVNKLKVKYLNYYFLKKNWLFTTMQIKNYSLFNSFNYCYIQHNNKIILNLKKTILDLNKQLNLFVTLTKKYFFPIIICSNFIYNPLSYNNYLLPINFLTQIKKNNLTNNFIKKYTDLSILDFSNNFIIALTNYSKPIKMLIPIISYQVKFSDYLINAKPYNFLVNYFYLKCILYTINNLYLCK